MGDKTRISWADATWNPVTGCTKVSPACDHCYAEGIATRFTGTPAYPHGFTVTLWPDRLTVPSHWTRPRRIFVCSMSDLFHHEVPTAFIAQVLGVAARCPHHTFLLLTKRHARLRDLFTDLGFAQAVQDAAGTTIAWPLPNVWVGVTVETQDWANIRVPALLSTPAAHRWVCMEPLLEQIHLPMPIHPWYVTRPCVDWVVVGGESGAHARRMDPGWLEYTIEHCKLAGVPLYMKQLGTVLAHELGIPGKGADPTWWTPPWPQHTPWTPQE